MMTNSDVTIFNLRIGADRREKLCATRILGVSWYGTKGETVLDTDRKDKAKCVIRIPATATVEAGKQYISEEKYKKLSDEEAERYWTIQKGAYIVRGQYVAAGQWLFDTFSFRQGIILKDTIEELAKLRQHDEDFVTVTEYADNTIRGTDRTKHWRIGVRDGTEKDHNSERLNHQFRERESGADLEPGFCSKKECSV